MDAPREVMRTQNGAESKQKRPMEERFKSYLPPPPLHCETIDKLLRNLKDSCERGFIANVDSFKTVPADGNTSDLHQTRKRNVTTLLPR